MNFVGNIGNWQDFGTTDPPLSLCSRAACIAPQALQGWCLSASSHLQASTSLCLRAFSGWSSHFAHLEPARSVREAWSWGQPSTGDWSALALKPPALLPSGVGEYLRGWFSTGSQNGPEGFSSSYPIATLITCLTMCILLDAFSSVSVFFLSSSPRRWGRDSCLTVMEMTRHTTVSLG